MDTSKQTPTPWRFGIPADSIVAGATDGDAPYVMYYGGDVVAESIGHADRAFIVRACNSHASWAKWIVRRGPGLPDHACAECVPSGDLVKAGFQCVYHEALAAGGAA